MPAPDESATDANKTVRVHLLDCGPEEYGDALVVLLDKVSVLVDGAHPRDFEGDGDKHPGLPKQIGKALGAGQPPYHVTLVIVTHAHEDHIGCLPKLVKDKVITADWALVVDPDHGWGKVPGAPDVAMDPRAARVLAGLREEEFKPSAERSLEQFLVDAATLETNYRDMIAALKKAKTKVVRYGTDSHAALVKALAAKGVKMRVLGPSLDQLAHTAQLLADQLDAVHDGFEIAKQSDADITAEDAFTALALDGKSRAGHLVNAQSLVTYFECGKKKLLLTGDMQLAAPGGDALLKGEVVKLRGEIEKLAPYHFAKLAHHGSDNGFNADILDEMQPSILGICAGEHSEKHPAKPVLELLKKNTDNLKWMRTDRHGGCIVDLTNKEPDLAPPDAINDPQSNLKDDAVTEIVKEPAKAPRVVVEKQTEVRVENSSNDFVEVIARIPMRKATVSITVSVDPHDSVATRTTTTGGGGMSRILRRDSGRQIAIANRDLSNILFVTNTDRLAERLGSTMDANRVVDALRAVPGAGVIADAGGGDAAAIAHDIASRRSFRPRGVVIIGGHEVVPLQSVDAVPDALRERIKGFRDPDDFTIWSDDIYAALDEDDIPDVPVSRIPDAGSTDFLATALSARPVVKPASRGGIRNFLRPFAGEVYRSRLRSAAGPDVLASSTPIGTGGQIPPITAADATYFMLHGDANDGREFSGEDESNNIIAAVNTDALPETWNGTVFAGCCWGALTTRRPAADGPSESRPVEESLALSFLARGAVAFIGCTGAHWSPTIPPYQYFGGPMHDAFWAAHASGSPPARALFEAKQSYVKSFPHALPNGKRTATSAAIEYKTWRQFTCLGLGW